MELKFNEALKTKGNSIDTIKNYKLVQYTPHIHFQADEDGACLRASEVKPKLDKFLFEYWEKNNIKRPADWLLKTESNSKALAYKISFRVGEKSSKDVKSIPEVNEKNGKRKPSYHGYFGDPKKIVTITGDIEMTLISKYSELLCVIDKCLEMFFALNCFGFRSTKGFGSYGIKGAKEEEKNILSFVDAYYTIPIKSSEDGLEKVSILANMMKAGVNNRGYYKGRIFRFFTQNGVGSDKAFIKQNVLPGELDDCDKSESRKKYKNFIYSRGAIGLAPQYEFRANDRKPRHGSKRCGTVIVKATDKKIERFNNPIWFIPRKDQIIIRPTVIPDKISNLEFIMKDKNTEKEDRISIPMIRENADVSKGEFNLIKYLDFFMDEFNKRKDADGAPEAIKNLMETCKITKHGGVNS